MAFDKLAYQREYARQHRAESVARVREWRLKDPANMQKARESWKTWRAADPEKALASKRHTYYRTKYGIELEEIEAMIEAQGGVCPICEIDISLGGKAGAHVDHEHDTGRIRGITCCNCNVGLGKFKDNPEFLKSAARYLVDGQEIS